MVGPMAKKAIILAAGKATRMYPLTLTRPKALLPVTGKALLAYNLEQLQGVVDEVILVVGYAKEQIRNTFGTRYGKLTLTYVTQEEQLGTGHALLQAEQYVRKNLKGSFLVMVGDDIFFQEDLEACFHHPLAVLVKKVPNPEIFGVVVEDAGRVTKIVEKPKHFISNLASIGAYTFDTEIFAYLRSAAKSNRGEYELPEALHQMVEAKEVSCVHANQWLPIGYPWDLLSANEYFLKAMEGKREGMIEKNVVINGPLSVGKGTVIKSGTYIEGPVMIGENCKIGPNSYLRPYTTIGNKCHIGQAVEIKNTIVMDNSNVPHLSYIGDSVLGEGVNLGAGTITANLRHDNQNIQAMNNGEKCDTGRRKLGAIIGDQVHTGINTSIYPGRKIWPWKATLPGEIVTKDIM